LKRRDDVLDKILARLQTSEGYAMVRSDVASDSSLIGLDSNENYFASADFILRIAEEAARCDLRTYPRGELLKLREMLGAWLRVEPECIVLANGGDQAIDLAATVLQKGGSAVAAWPTYSLYGLRVELAGGKLVRVPLQKDFSLDVPRLLSAADQSRASIMFLCSPNNPTANQFSENDLVEVLTGFPGLMVLDEAYAEFTERSLVSLIREYPNLAVMRTFSKAFGIAGARLGYMIANPRVSKIFAEKVQFPYPVSRFSARLGIECLRNLDAMQDGVSKVKRERSWLIDRLRRVEGLRVFDSETNFVLVCTNRDSSALSARLRSLGISVKDVGDVLDFRGCLRVTVGTRPMNEKFLAGLEEVMSDEQL
jgi:histidinol-phosphate aminotransferase